MRDERKKTNMFPSVDLVILFSKVLKKPEYFGKYGKIFKVVINQNTVYSGAQVSCKGSFSPMGGTTNICTY